MKASLKRAWVAKLRSGDIPQGREALAIEDRDGGPVRMCCLGVLCEVIDPDGWLAARVNGRDVVRSWTKDGRRSDARSRAPLSLSLISATEQEHLTRMNDIPSNSFTDIANWIEDNLVPDEDD